MDPQFVADGEPAPAPEVEQLDQNSRALTPTPITTSACMGKALAEYLDAGGDPNAFENGKVLHFLFDGWTNPLLMAADAGQLDAVRLLLDRGANPNLIDSFDVTALMHAVAPDGPAVKGVVGHHAVVELLLERGASLNTAMNCKSKLPEKHIRRQPNHGRGVQGAVNGSRAAAGARSRRQARLAGRLDGLPLRVLQ